MARTPTGDGSLGRAVACVPLNKGWVSWIGWVINKVGSVGRAGSIKGISLLDWMGLPQATRDRSLGRTGSPTRDGFLERTGSLKGMVFLNWLGPP